MAGYFVLGAVFVAFALGLSAIGIMRDDFPTSRTAGRSVIAVAGTLALVTLVVLLVSTEREHPREEAKAEAAERAAEKGVEPGQPGEAAGEEGGSKNRAGGPLTVIEDEYSIKLPVDVIDAGPYSFDVRNEGKIQHDLAVAGGATVPKKTPLIDPGARATTDEVQLQPGTYELICTVPGHEELGMKTKLDVE